MNGKFTKIPKSLIERIDKISIFEYFKITKLRKEPKLFDNIDLELLNYMTSKDFNEEFKGYFKSNKNNQLFNFYLINRSLLRNRISNLLVNEGNTAIKIEFFLSKFLSNELIINFIDREYSSIANIVVEDEIGTKYKKEEISYLRNKSKFDKIITSNDFDQIKSHITLHLFNINNKTPLDTIKVDKITTFIIAHLNYINSLSLDDILYFKIYWGLKNTQLIDNI